MNHHLGCIVFSKINRFIVVDNNHSQTVTRKKSTPSVPVKAEPIPDYTAPRAVLRKFASRLLTLNEDFQEENIGLKIEAEYLESTPNTRTKQPVILVNFVDLEQEKSVFSALRPTIRFAAQGSEKIMISATIENDIPDNYESIILRLDAPEPTSLQFLEETMNEILEKKAS